LCNLDPALGAWADDFTFAEVWARPGLSHDERMIVAITALAASGSPDQMRNYLWGALQSGISAHKIHEALLMLVVYVGFPRALNGLAVWRSVVDAARKSGISVDLDDAPADTLPTVTQSPFRWLQDPHVDLSRFRVDRRGDGHPGQRGRS
jgi:4-carboxymuconolactone decarboxylase